jgi:hypothetical protein
MALPNVCAECGAQFPPTKSYQRFCSRRCQREAGARQDRLARQLLKAARRILAETEREAA